MLFKKQKSLPTHSILLIGLLALVICQIHPTIGHEHEQTASTQEPCQIIALSSAGIAGPIVTGPNKASSHADRLLTTFSSLDFNGVFSYGGSGHAGPLISPLSSAKRYQLICTYRL